MSKINLVLQAWPKNAVVTSKWLLEHGVSYELKKQYETSGWVISLGSGAVIRPKDNVQIEGALHALQYQLHKDIHIGARSALERKGQGHYIRSKQAPLFLFVKPRIAIEKWFLHFDWGCKIQYIHSNVIDTDFGMEEENVGEFKIKISSTERAILEMLCFTPQYFSFAEAASIMEHLSWLRSDLTQQLLENCTSYKGKRLFLFLGEYYHHPWVTKLDKSKIDLGKGKLSMFKGGSFNSKYNITLPKDFVSNEQSSVF